ncbi:type II and III secretion system protein family protein [Brevundimonas staleyi]|uniref:Type II and III secretion system protein family protein n=1 Tax=Brevundimonas staleyi TaxID=74326 RepID=A0ABW0FR34_9CAUL
MSASVTRPTLKTVIALACAGLVAAGAAAPVTAQTYGARQTVAAGSGPRLVNLPRGTSFAVDLPADARDVIVSNPAVAEANVHSPRRITVIGIAPGETDAVFLDAAGRAILTLRVRVDAGTSALQDTLSRMAPGSQVHAEAVNDSIILTGLVTSAAEADRVVSVARAFVSAPEKVLNMLSVAGSDQVTLKVRVVEVQRNAIKQLGMSSDVVFNSGNQSVSFGRGNTWGANGQAMGGGGACFNQDRARTTNYSNTSSTNNQTTSGSNTSNTNTNTTSNNSTNTITNTTSNSSGTTLTTSDGRTITFTGAAPNTIQVVDYNGNTITLSGELAAEYLRSTVSGTSLSNAVSGTLGSTVASSLVSVIGSTITGNTGNLLTNLVQNVASSTYSAVTGNNVGACLQAFERVGLIRTLAEPNLSAVNGESASFLAGGEFPIPVGRDRDGNITIQYKPYGVSLAFRPVVLSGGNISLQVSMEVSELQQGGGLTVGAGTPSALTLPGLGVRRSATTVEIPSGGSMMIAGLLQESTRQTVDSLPGVTNLPVLGGLFRSRDYLSGETELVMIVEPYIVSPTSPGRMQTPADGLRIANDAQTIFFGQLNQAYGSPAPTASPSAGWQGPVGYVIE